MSKKLPLLNLLQEHQLDYFLHEHEPLFTVDEGKHISAKIAGAHSKNLFLRDKKKNYFLVSVLEHKRVDLKALSKLYGKGGLSFASAEELDQKLQLLPGSVTPYALMFDRNNEVKFILDQDFLKFDIVNFHPLQNNLTMSMDINAFLRFFELVKHLPEVVNIPEVVD